MVVHYPVLNGNTTYSVSALLNAQLIQNNTANFSYAINGNAVQFNASTVDMPINLKNVPITQNTTITFETKGDQNYAAVDPTIVILPTNIVEYIPITLTNIEAVAYPTNAQVQVNVNALKYNINGNYYSSNAINAEFFI